MQVKVKIILELSSEQSTMRALINNPPQQSQPVSDNKDFYVSVLENTNSGGERRGGESLWAVFRLFLCLQV